LGMLSQKPLFVLQHSPGLHSKRDSKVSIDMI
jgi:hypothetical protein